MVNKNWSRPWGRPTYYRCGICDHYHSAQWLGDCRDDDNRFFSDQLDERHGREWDEVEMEELDDWLQDQYYITRFTDGRRPGLLMILYGQPGGGGPSASFWMVPGTAELEA